MHLKHILTSDMRLASPYFCLIIISLTFQGCSKDKSHPFIDQVTLEFKENIIFPLDSMTKRNSKNIGFSSKINALYLYNEINHSIYFFDLETKLESKRIKLEKEGPNGIGDVSKLIVLNYDSIFTFNRYNNHLYLLNRSGDIIEKTSLFSINEPDPSIQTFSPSISYSNVNKSLYLPIRPNSRTDNKRQTVVLEYNVLNGEKKFIKQWPKEYNSYSNIGTTSFATLDEKNSKMLISFAFDDNIHEIDLKTGKEDIHYFGSDRLNEISVFKGKQEMQIIMEYMSASSKYRNVFFDKHANYYLRTGLVGKKIPEGEFKRGEKYKTINNDDIYNLIVILDSNFQKVGEVHKAILLDEVFSTSNGLYMKAPLVNRNNEDILVFKRYEYVQK